MTFNRQQQHAPGPDRIELRDVCALRIGTQSYKYISEEFVHLRSINCYAKKRIGSLKRNR
jgi:hypothetical protein